MDVAVQQASDVAAPDADSTRLSLCCEEIASWVIQRLGLNLYLFQCQRDPRGTIIVDEPLSFQTVTYVRLMDVLRRFFGFYDAAEDVDQKERWRDYLDICGELDYSPPELQQLVDAERRIPRSQWVIATDVTEDVGDLEQEMLCGVLLVIVRQLKHQYGLVLPNF